MTESKTLQFESGRVLQSLYANDLRLLKALEEQLTVKVTTRDGWLRVEGEPEQIEQTRQVFDQLERARQGGVGIRKHEFLYALSSVFEGSAEEGGLDSLLDTKVTTSSKRGAIVPKTLGQRAYLRAMQGTDMVFGIGPAGTGKTYLAMAMAVNALKKDQVTRIILTRPAVEAGEALGFLPGDLKEKIMPYLRPLYDALQDMLEPDEMQRYMERGVIEIAPLAYMRGRTLNRAFIVLDEAQNTTTEQMFMFLTRLGAESKAVITGDHTQIDLPTNKRSGLVEAMQALRDLEGITFCHFSDRDVIRHELVQSIVKAYRRHRGTGETETKR
ncbi:MAG TPA: PhoH family protein [Chthoniobacteraceae bacterium]|jgi:phosphate starvation-inducible PhoH-like protein|nr:ybeZ [Chthoniobacter sp.]HEV7869522.1 PhoH family protein [Chthoniobacteraceae bacterium]